MRKALLNVHCLITFKIEYQITGMMKRKLIIRGSRVQDIGYRMFLLNLASEHDLIGFQARNIGKNAVEALYEGDDASVSKFESEVKELIPDGAKVEGIEFEDYDGPVKDIEKFRSYFTTLQLGKMIEVGITMIQKQDETLKELKAFREESRENQQTMIQKQDETLKELKGVREDFNTILDKRLVALEKEVLMIKEKLGIK